MQAPAPVAVIKVAPFTRHGPDSEMLVGAPEPVVVKSWMLAFAGAGMVAPFGQAALPWTPIDIGSSPTACLTDIA